jgi:hypothetical protein
MRSTYLRPFVRTEQRTRFLAAFDNKHRSRLKPS